MGPLSVLGQEELNMKQYGTKLLPAYSVSEELFDEILAGGYTIKLVEDPNEFNTYKYGYPEKTVIVYDGFKNMILLECVLNEHYPLNIRLTHWKQCILHKDITQDIRCEEDINGGQAYNYMKSLICHYYSEDEYNKCLKDHEAEYNEELAQYHFSMFEKTGHIFRYENCYKWDINGAHNDALCEIFPKAAAAITVMFQQRKKYPVNKKYVNYYCGMLASKGHRGTYNWIIQRTTKLLLDGINKAGGTLLYANTDGFLIQHPDHIIPHSIKLGEFKLEYQGPVWFYYDKNYNCFQLDNGEIKGTPLLTVRKLIDLPNRKVVHYDRVKKGDVFIAENIEMEVLANGLYKERK
jgi:hypothetical protein